VQDQPQFDRLYVIVRGDLSPGLAAAQAVHAAFQFSREHPSLTEPWMQDSQYLVIVTVPSIEDLWDKRLLANERGIQSSIWHEPDMGNQATALVLAPCDGARRMCANLPLFGRDLMPT
jgi:peptidyl-tRNA hydrolase